MKKDIQKPVLGIAMGDPAGVGPEIIAKLIANGFFKEFCIPVFIGGRKILERAFDVIGSPSVSVTSVRDASAVDFESDAVQVVEIDGADSPLCEFGKVSLAGGKICLAELTAAVQLCKTHMIEGFCFAPLNKAGMKAAGMHFESEHYYLADVFHVTNPFGEINVVGSVWTTRTTSHIPIKEVSQNLSIEKILRAVSLCASTLKSSGVTSPRIAVAALNPHCGENGLCGREEIDIIEPAVRKAVDDGIAASGPYSSDILFIKAFQGKFDGVVTMYHDQGQIALKLKGFDEGITIAGGQPYPIVTCGHGTAYDIAGKNIVKTSSFENAVKMAARMANHIAGRN